MGWCVSAAGRSFDFDLVNRFVTEAMILHVQTAPANGGRVGLDWRAEGGRIADIGKPAKGLELRVTYGVPFSTG